MTDHSQEASRDAIVAMAADSIARGSRSFALASRLFDRQTRERAWLLYAWCRRCDDIADAQDHGGAAVADSRADAAARLALIRAATARVLAGTRIGDPAFDALGIVAAECAIPHRLIDDVIEGFALDAAGWRPQSEDDLLRYCYHVAGAVGCAMAVVMGVKPDDEATLARACDQGLAFQLANIARDVAEDAANGRCYLPKSWLDDAGIAEADIMAPANRPQIAAMIARLADLAERYEASGRAGAARLPFRARWAVLAAAGIYGDIARTARRRGEAALDRRVVTPASAKLSWVVRSLGQAWRAPAAASRDGLWTMPREPS